MMINKRLINQVSQSKKYIWLIVLVNWIGLLCNIVITFNITFILTKLLNQKTDDILKNFIIVIIFILVRVCCNILAGRFAYYTTVEVKQVLREKIYKKLLKIGTSYNEKITTSEVVQVSIEGIEQLEIYFSRYLPQLFYSLIVPITLFIVIMPISFISALILLLCVPLIPISIAGIQKFAKKLFSKYWGEYTNLGDEFLDNIQGLTTLKIYQTDEFKNEKMNEQAEVFRKVTMQVLIMQLNSVSMMDLIAFGGAAIGVILAITQFINGNIDISGAIIIILLSAEFFIPLRLLGSFFHIAMNGMSASEKIFRIIDIPEKAEKTEELKDGKISFKNVNFSYDSERQILKDINLNLEEGKLVALVGQSGCGKSTIASLIMGANSNYTGSINIGQAEAREINEANLMSNITLINHNGYIFKGTIEENLKMAKKNATKEEMENALKMVNLYSFIENQGGLQFKLDEKGANLSGGQIQRLSLARAILHDSKIYIFDEATSNIDAESEEIIVDIMYKIAKEKTVLVISHRLFNIIKADNIYVIEKGVITEEGNHHELMKNEGEYYQLYSSQQQLENYVKEVV